MLMGTQITAQEITERLEELAHREHGRDDETDARLEWSERPALEPLDLWWMLAQPVGMADRAMLDLVNRLVAEVESLRTELREQNHARSEPETATINDPYDRYSYVPLPGDAFWVSSV